MVEPARVPFVVVLRLGDFASRIEAEMEASKRFGSSVQLVQSQVSFQCTMDEASAVRRERRRTE